MKISAGNDKKRCSCECPEGRSFPHEGEVMPGIVPLGKLFFRLFWTFQQLKKQFYRKAAVISLPLARVPSLAELIIGKIIRPILRWRSKHLIALDNGPAMSARYGLIFVRVGRDDPGAARRQTIDQPSIGRDSKHSDAH